MTKEKVDAVFELREAAQELGRQQEKLERDGSPEQRDAVLDARLEVEGKTAEAVEACAYCGREHCDDEGHRARRMPNVTHAGEKVIRLEFGQQPSDKIRAQSEAGKE